MGKAPNNAAPNISGSAPDGICNRLRGHLRNSLLKMWRVRGGGFYGFGFVIYFVVAQSLSLLSDIAAAKDLIDFLSTQILESLIRLISDTPGNFIAALLWPLRLLSWLGSGSLLLLLAAFISFDRWIKPWLNERHGLASESEPRPGQDSARC